MLASEYSVHHVCRYRPQTEWNKHYAKFQVRKPQPFFITYAFPRMLGFWRRERHVCVCACICARCVCMRVRDANSNTVPQSDRERTYEDNADCCGCTCEWWTDGRQTIFRQTERESIIVATLLNLSYEVQKHSQENKSIFSSSRTWKHLLIVRTSVIYSTRTSRLVHRWS
jgi:hypothetical protein